MHPQGEPRIFAPAASKLGAVLLQTAEDVRSPEEAGTLPAADPSNPRDRSGPRAADNSNPGEAPVFHARGAGNLREVSVLHTTDPSNHGEASGRRAADAGAFGNAHVLRKPDASEGEESWGLSPYVCALHTAERIKLAQAPLLLAEDASGAKGVAVSGATQASNPGEGCVFHAQSANNPGEASSMRTDPAPRRDAQGQPAVLTRPARLQDAQAGHAQSGHAACAVQPNTQAHVLANIEANVGGAYACAARPRDAGAGDIEANVGGAYARAARPRDAGAGRRAAPDPPGPSSARGDMMSVGNASGSADRARKRRAEGEPVVVTSGGATCSHAGLPEAQHKRACVGNDVRSINVVNTLGMSGDGESRMGTVSIRGPRSITH